MNQYSNFKMFPTLNTAKINHIQFILYICINNCVKKHKTKYKFVKVHKIECCGNNEPVIPFLIERNSFLQEEHMNKLREDQRKLIIIRSYVERRTIT